MIRPPAIAPFKKNRKQWLALLTLCAAIPAQADIQLAPGKDTGDLKTISAAPLQDELLKPTLDRTSQVADSTQADVETDGIKDDVRAQFAKGVAYAQANQPAEAITIFTQIIESHPTLPEPYNNLAVIYADQGDYEKAQKLLERVIKIHPDYATAQENLGDIYIKMAAETYGKSFKLDGKNKRVYAKQQQASNLIANLAEASTAAGTPPAAKKSETRNGDIREVNQVTVAINDWLQSWENRDMAGYLASYTDDFVGQGEASHTAWVKSRTARITGANSISVKYSKLKVVLENGNTATATFMQSYRSDSYQDRTSKKLILKKIDGKWLISQELT